MCPPSAFSEERGDFSNMLVTAYIPKLYTHFMRTLSETNSYRLYGLYWCNDETNIEQFV